MRYHKGKITQAITPGLVICIRIYNIAYILPLTFVHKLIFLQSIYQLRRKVSTLIQSGPRN